VISVQELLKDTNPDHPDYEDLCRSLARLEEVRPSRYAAVDVTVNSTRTIFSQFGCHCAPLRQITTVFVWLPRLEPALSVLSILAPVAGHCC
jgi:hypothetical protein